MKKQFDFFNSQGFVALDCETTGLQVYGGDNAFGMSIAAPGVEHYYPITDELVSCLISFFANYKGYLFYHNAKFDMAFFKKLGCNIHYPKSFCTLTLGRLVNSDLLSYSLDSLGKTIGMEKDKGLEQFCIKNKLFEYILRPGKKKRDKKLFFDKVPLEIMIPYAKKDVEITLQLGNNQLKQLSDRGELAVASNEARLIHTFFRMEEVGVKIDRDFVTRAMVQEAQKMQQAVTNFQSFTGVAFKDHHSTFKAAFTALGVTPKLTDKGNPSFDKKALAAINHPLARWIEDYREAHGLLGTYETILYYADKNDALHANVRQSGTATGRVSYTDPPLQCIKKDEDLEDEAVNDKDAMFIREAFIPRPKYCFVMMDFDQFEYRMMLNYAQEHRLIEEVKGGLDVHEATARLVGVTRKQAKQLNFLMLYGGGIDLLASKLGVTYNEAKFLRQEYFAKVPAVQAFIYRIREYIQRYEFIQNWLGRRYKIPKHLAYKGPNYLIQGGAADWVKVAMNRIDDLIIKRQFKSRMLLQIHDEILFEVHESEVDLLPQFKEILENVTDKNPHNNLQYTVGIKYSRLNWHKKQEWFDGCFAAEKKTNRLS